MSNSRTVVSPIWANLLLSLTSLFVALVLAEIFMQYLIGKAWFPPYYVNEFENRESPSFIPDDNTGWRMRPEHNFIWEKGGRQNQYVSNSSGFRSDKEFAQKGAIALIGDSFSFATGVDYPDTFSALLEKKLGSTPVYNFAMPGFGIDQMWQSLEHQVLPLEPSLIIVAFIDHDLDRSLTAYRIVEGFNKPSFILDQNGLRPRTAGDQPPGLIKLLQRHSAIANGISNGLRQIGFNYPVGAWFKINAEIFSQMNKEANQAGVRLLFVRLPLVEQSNFISLAHHMGSIGANYLDLAGAEREYPAEGIFIIDDGHLNEAGHQYVTEEIYRWLQTQP